MVVNAVDEGQPKVRAQPTKKSVRPARSRYSAAAEGAKGWESELVRNYLFPRIRAGMGPRGARVEGEKTVARRGRPGLHTGSRDTKKSFD